MNNPICLYAEKVNFILDRSANDKFIIYNRDGRIFEKVLPYQNVRSIALKRDNLEGDSLLRFHGKMQTQTQRKSEMSYREPTWMPKEDW